MGNRSGVPRWQHFSGIADAHIRWHQSVERVVRSPWPPAASRSAGPPATGSPAAGLTSWLTWRSAKSGMAVVASTGGEGLTRLLAPPHTNLRSITDTLSKLGERLAGMMGEGAAQLRREADDAVQTADTADHQVATILHPDLDAPRTPRAIVDPVAAKALSLGKRPRRRRSSNSVNLPLNGIRPGAVGWRRSSTTTPPLPGCFRAGAGAIRPWRPCRRQRAAYGTRPTSLRRWPAGCSPTARVCVNTRSATPVKPTRSTPRCPEAAPSQRHPHLGNPSRRASWAGSWFPGR